MSETNTCGVQTGNIMGLRHWRFGTKSGSVFEGFAEGEDPEHIWSSSEFQGNCVHMFLIHLQLTPWMSFLGRKDIWCTGDFGVILCVVSTNSSEQNSHFVVLEDLERSPWF